MNRASQEKRLAENRNLLQRAEESARRQEEDGKREREREEGERERERRGGKDGCADACGSGYQRI